MTNTAIQTSDIEKSLVLRRKRKAGLALSDKTVSTAKPKDKDYKLTDGNGLYLFVKTGGGKLWRWKYYLDGKEKLLTFGAYPAVSLSEAQLKLVECRKVPQNC